MTRAPLDHVPQRELVYRLRLLLDRHDDRSTAQIKELVALNPRSVFSTKVIHNIGKKRLAKLTRIVEPADDAARARVRAALPIRSEASRRVSSA